MTNLENFLKKNQIGHGNCINKDTYEIQPCNCCDDCLLYDNYLAACDNTARILEWLNSEYISPLPSIDWTKVEVDTPIYVKYCKNDPSWIPRYFARYKNNCVYAFANGTTSFSSAEEPIPWKYAKLVENS